MRRPVLDPRRQLEALERTECAWLPEARDSARSGGCGTVGEFDVVGPAIRGIIPNAQPVQWPGGLRRTAILFLAAQLLREFTPGRAMAARSRPASGDAGSRMRGPQPDRAAAYPIVSSSSRPIGALRPGERQAMIVPADRGRPASQQEPGPRMSRRTPGRSPGSWGPMRPSGSGTKRLTPHSGPPHTGNDLSAVPDQPSGSRGHSSRFGRRLRLGA